LEEADSKIILCYVFATQFIPQVKFEDLDKLSEEVLDGVRRCGCVVVKDVVDDDKAVEWRESLKEFVKVNQDVEGEFMVVIT
jgi:hypothetical protein